MPQDIAEKLIEQAKSVLIENKLDEIHDVFHHYKVWENAIEVFYSESLQCDLNLIEVVVWWHDISKSDPENSKEDNFELFETSANSLGLDHLMQNKIKEIIMEHQTMNTQSSIESKVLYDADKIEYVSISRILLAQRFLTDEVRNIYEQKWRKNMEERYLSLNFEYSKKIFKQKLDVLQKYGKGLFLSPELMNVKL
jgi:HD superfamily phosphodiesterase